MLLLSFIFVQDPHKLSTAII